MGALSEKLTQKTGAWSSIAEITPNVIAAARVGIIGSICHITCRNSDHEYIYLHVHDRVHK